MGKNEVRHGHFKNCRNPKWHFIKTIEIDAKVYKKWHGDIGKNKKWRVT